MRGRRHRRKLPAADGAGTRSARTPYSFASGVLPESDMPATMAETLKVGIEDYLATH